MYLLDKTCLDSAINQYRKSLKREDLTDEDRVVGAIQAYKRMEDANKMYDSKRKLKC